MHEKRLPTDVMVPQLTLAGWYQLIFLQYVWCSYVENAVFPAASYKDLRVSISHFGFGDTGEERAVA